MPDVSPVTVAVVGGGEPVIVFGVCAVDPMYGVILYEVGCPPLDGAVQETLADVRPPSTALTFVTAPGAGIGMNRTSTQ